MWPLFEVFNETTVIQNGDENAVQIDDPVLRTLLTKADEISLDEHILNRAIELYRINKDGGFDASSCSQVDRPIFKVGQ